MRRTNMEIKTCEEYVLAELDRLQKENERLKNIIEDLKITVMELEYNSEKGEQKCTE